jgi:cation diffusion facilitator CzcD-associated flavoprotein CzcO
MSSRSPRICIVGAGMSGMLMAIKLKAAGYTDYVIYEKAATIGGTWRDNRYPGVACDVASFSYCYAFEPKHNWSHRFSPGPEIFDYFKSVADKHQLNDNIRFNTEVLRAQFKQQQWHLETSHGDREVFDVMIAATGPLRERKYPPIPGLDNFAGACFHSADWQDELDISGQRIGVIGTGSSAVQMTAPLAEQASHLTLFQRTPQWIMGTPNPAYSRLGIALKKRLPVVGWVTRKLYDWVGEQFGLAALDDGLRRRLIDFLCRKNLESVADPELRRKLTPDHKAMCKRMIMSPNYYPALQQDHVDVVCDDIERIEGDGVVTKDGMLHKLDVLILATGFYPNAWGIGEVVGDQGKTLRQTWAEGTRTYRSITLPGFPNYFMLIGPNSPITNLSLIDIADIGVDYALQCIDKMRNGELTSLSPKADVTQAFNDDLRHSFGKTVWVSGCDSWYFDEDGIPQTWPWPPKRYKRELKTLELAHYDVCRSEMPAAIANETAELCDVT